MFEERRIVKRWDELMENCFKEGDMRYLVYSIKKEDWGYNLMVTIPAGKRFEDLEKLKDAIKVFYPCNVEMEIRKLTSLANVKLITKDFSSQAFKPIKLKSNELLFGYDLMDDPIIVDMNEFPHVLIAGMTGQGKSRLLLIILTNLLYSYENNMEIYLTALSKNDHKIFKDHPAVKSYLRDIADIKKLYENLNKLREKREEIIDKAGCINISEYNNKSKFKMSYIYIFADEFSLYMPDDSDSKQVEEDKKVALALLKIIIKEARSAGIFVILGIQVSTYQEMPTIIRRCCNVKVTFKQSDEVSSKVIINTTDAIFLEKQEFIIFSDSYIHCKTPYIDSNIVKSCISVPKTEKPPQTNIVNAQLIITSIQDVEPRKYKKHCEQIFKKVEDLSNVGQLPRGKRGVLNANSKR